MNRLSDLSPEEAEEEYGDFFVVAGEFGAACVTRETAERIERVLDRQDVPAWITRASARGERGSSAVGRLIE